MANSLFITGASGFIGSRLLQRLDSSQYESIYCLSRCPAGVPAAKGSNGKLRIVEGDILDHDAYANCLRPGDTVVHLAASTGRASRDEHVRVNATGTRRFADLCQRQGIRNFLHVSTIAVNYPDKSHYPYALSKEMAEQAVEESGLNYAIVRPTIVIGEGSPIWKSLSMLARAPLIPLLGEGEARIQPIYVDDLVDGLLTILGEGLFCNQTFELGGPQPTTFRGFLSEIHYAYSKRDPRFMWLPLKLLTRFLSLLEVRFHAMLPVTAGQLSAFSNDGTILGNQLVERHAPGMKGIREMIELTIEQQDKRLKIAELEQQCRAFAWYLIGKPPSNYVLDKYREAHVASEALEGSAHQPFERFLVRLATKNHVGARMVDAYAAFFAKGSLFRRKMVLLMAILESCAPSHVFFEEADSGGRARLLIRLFLRGVLFAITLLVATILLFPLRIAMSLTPGGRGGQNDG